MERILIVRLGAMGDVIHALPAVAGLRAGMPGARIGWVIEERWVDLLAAPGALHGPGGTPQKPLADVIHVVDTKAWRTAALSDETWNEIRGVIAEIRASRYEVAIDFQGLLKSAFFAHFSGAPMVLGPVAPKEKVATLFYSRAVETDQPHVVDKNIELTAALPGYAPTPPGLAPGGSFLGDPTALWFPRPHYLPLDEAAGRWCEAELGRRNVREFVLITPGGGWGAKLWPAERYGAVAAALRRQDLSVLVNFGPREESLAAEVVEASKGEAQSLQCSVAELTALTRRARLVIGGDSGPVHLAAALDIPVLAIFGPTDPVRNGPLGCARRIVLRAPESETSYAHVGTVDAGLAGITVARVTEFARRILEHRRG